MFCSHRLFCFFFCNYFCLLLPLFLLPQTSYPELEETHAELRLLEKLYDLYVDVIVVCVVCFPFSFQTCTIRLRCRIIITGRGARSVGLHSRNVLSSFPFHFRLAQSDELTGVDDSTTIGVLKQPLPLTLAPPLQPALPMQPALPLLRP